jgi:hypothetical protein
MTDSAVPADEFKSKRPNSERAGFVFRAGRPLTAPAAQNAPAAISESLAGVKVLLTCALASSETAHYDCLAPPNEAKDDKTRGSKDDPAAVGVDPEW